jgi:hypothetical protein
MMVADISGAYHALLLPGTIAGGIAFLLSWECNGEPAMAVIDPSVAIAR